MTSPPASACLNCGSTLTGEFCSSCGQKIPHPDLTLREFLHETTEQIVNWDGKIPQTLKTLLIKPGALTIDFLEGRRARWLMPLRVYLICSVLYFVTKQVVETDSKQSARPVAQMSLRSEDGSTKLTPEDVAEIEQGLPARIFGKERLLRAAANNAQLNTEINKTFPKAMFVLLPFFALLTRIAWRRRWPHYPSHLYLALHVHAAWFTALFVSLIATQLPAVIGMPIAVGAFVYVVWYALAAFRRVFADSWPRTLLKSAVVTIVYGLAFGVVGLAMLGYAITRM